MLDNHGKLAVAETVIYVIILAICIFNTFQHGFRKETGWIYLALFCIARLIGSIILIVVQSSNNTSIDLYIAASILNSIGLSPLLSATLGFINTCANFSVPPQNPLFMKSLRWSHSIIIVAIVLGVVGGSKQADTDPASISSAIQLTKVAAILLLVSWVLISASTIFLWRVEKNLPRSVRKLYHAVFFSLSFLCVRVIYSLLSAYAARSSSANPVPTSKYSPISGNWLYLLVQGVLMEFVVVSGFAITGLWIYFGTPDSEYGARDVEDPKLDR